jgi:hypothetical protein
MIRRWWILIGPRLGGKSRSCHRYEQAAYSGKGSIKSHYLFSVLLETIFRGHFCPEYLVIINQEIKFL